MCIHRGIVEGKSLLVCCMMRSSNTKGYIDDFGV